MATIVDIAKKLNVSPSTVSRALAASTQVSERTRMKVARVAKELNYTPNLVARNLRRSFTHTIGCLVFEYTNPFFVPMIQGIEDVVHDQGYSVMISQSRRSLAIEKRLVQSYSMHQISGLIVMPVIEETAHILDLRSRGTPVISVGRLVSGIDCISIDNQRGGSLTAGHFADLGYRKAGMVLSGEPHNEPERARLKGFRGECERRGLALREEWILSVGNNRTEGGMVAAQRWHDLRDRPTAVFCSNDRLAIGFVHRLRQLGCRIPQDCAVAGFDDLPDAEFLEIPLTTIAYPKYRMGEAAARWLIESIEGRPRGDRPSGPEHRCLEPRLITRRSSTSSKGV